ncbi:hypothetical protein T484DRAFT_1867309, partial [Baffinella frigidus]
CRDALGKALYNNLFDYLVTRVNHALNVSEGNVETVEVSGLGIVPTVEVSVLDIFGFETSTLLLSQTFTPLLSQTHTPTPKP